MTNEIIWKVSVDKKYKTWEAIDETTGFTLVIKYSYEDDVYAATVFTDSLKVAEYEYGEDYGIVKAQKEFLEEVKKITEKG